MADKEVTELERIEQSDFFQEVIARQALRGSTFWQDVFNDLKEEPENKELSR